MRIAPVFQKQAKAFIGKHHRHNIPSIASVFNVGLVKDGELIGVAMVGIPKARLLMDGQTLEVTRVCVTEGNRNANSMLYGACARAAAALGYDKLVTYTLESESGSSLRAAGWTRDDALRDHDVGGWENHGGRGSEDMFGNSRLPSGPKVRWWKRLGAPNTGVAR